MQNQEQLLVCVVIKFEQLNLNNSDFLMLSDQIVCLLNFDFQFLKIKSGQTIDLININWRSEITFYISTFCNNKIYICITMLFV